jgi:inorganic pyrophosphatase/exopolyphosphatase
MNKRTKFEREMVRARRAVERHGIAEILRDFEQFGDSSKAVALVQRFGDTAQVEECRRIFDRKKGKQS